MNYTFILYYTNLYYKYITQFIMYNTIYNLKYKFIIQTPY